MRSRFQDYALKTIFEEGRTMNIRMMKCVAVVLVLAASALAQTWVEFSVSSEGVGTSPLGINASGQVAGWYIHNSHFLGFVRNADGTIIKLSAPKGTYLEATTINTAGVVAGNMLYDYNQNVGFYGPAAGPFQEFGSNRTYVGGINDAGYVAGTHVHEQCCTTGFLLKPNGEVTGFPIAKYGTVTGINNSNQIVGYTIDEAGDRGFLYESGKITHLNVHEAADTLVAGINDSGEAAGGWLDSSNVFHGFLWTQAQGFTSFDVPHATATQASAINSGGVVVGSFSDTSGHSHGFIRDAAGQFTTLSAPHALNTYPAGINASGQVTGSYTIGTRQVYHGFIYTP
jgi:hypothetical protein